MSTSELGKAIAAARPSVRFRADNSRQIQRTMPDDVRTLVDMADAVLAAGYDLREPDLWLGEAGIGIRLVTPTISGHVMRAGEVSTLYRPDDLGHVAFVDAVFGAVQRATKPHVVKMTGERTSVRIGPNAEEWWRADDRRQLQHESSNAVYYRLVDISRRGTFSSAD
jgi:hypothetical protein